MQKGSLTLEQKELIAEAMATDAGQAILRLLDGLARIEEDALLRLDCQDADERRLWLTKARAEGARKLVRAFETQTKLLKSKA